MFCNVIPWSKIHNTKLFCNDDLFILATLIVRWPSLCDDKWWCFSVFKLNLLWFFTGFQLKWVSNIFVTLCFMVIIGFKCDTSCSRVFYRRDIGQTSRSWFSFCRFLDLFFVAYTLLWYGDLIYLTVLLFFSIVFFVFVCVCIYKLLIPWLIFWKHVL